MLMPVTINSKSLCPNSLHLCKSQSPYSAYVCPGLQVFDGLIGQVLFVKLPVDLWQLRHPESIAVLHQDLPDAKLDLLRVIGLSFTGGEPLIHI